jgi:CelD/BcsL family acetyltransferase involved in cellulose biosynthesis
MSRTDASPVANKLRVQVIDTEEGFDALEPAWNALYDEGGTSPFQTFAWQRAWWRHYAEPDPRMRLLILAVHQEAAAEESTVMAIAPFFTERRRVAGMFPTTRIDMIGRRQSDYLDLLVQPTAASASFAALAENLHRVRNRFDVLLLQNVPDCSPSFSPFIEALGRRGFRVDGGAGEHCLRTTFGQTWEQTEQALPLAARGKTMRRKMRLLVTRHGAELEFVRDPARLGEGLSDLFTLHQQRWTQRGRPGDYGTAVNTEFLREAAFGLASRGQLVLAFLRLDGRRIAGVCGFRHRDEFHFYAAGMGDAGEAARYSPGVGLHLMLMRALFEDGVRVYDHLRGAEPYKADLGGIAVPTWRATVFDGSARLARGVHFIDQLHAAAQRRLEYERQLLRALRADPSRGAFDIWQHVRERLGANRTDVTRRLRPRR